MVKEFQQLRMQMTQILLEKQQQQQEIEAIIVKQAQEKKQLFLAIIGMIESLEKKEEIAIRTLKLESVSNQNSPSIYNNLKNDLVKLLATHDVQPIAGENSYSPTKFSQKTPTTEKEIYPKTKYSYQGKVLNA